ncbi:MAG: 50S ribosomal protein L4 [Candidatus Krumholzibacteriota bacterium]|nr:50S ribosomal protein L4 [Candidatus Krumholzibacteriota bacterium]
MASAKVYNFDGELKGNMDLPESLFEADVDKSVLYDVIRAYMANRRSGTAQAKSRGEVRFSKAKPYRQKGTGRARAGKRSSPIWKGGGVVFGPRKRDYRTDVPKKVRRKALKSVLSDKFNDDCVVVVEGFSMEKPKTKDFVKFLQSAGLNGKKILFATDGFDENIYKSVRNIAGVEFILGRNLNAYEILKADVLLLTKESLSSLEEVFV